MEQDRKGKGGEDGSKTNNDTSIVKKSVERGE